MKRFFFDKKDRVPQQTGSVYGSVGYAHKPGYTIVPFALVWIGSKRDIANSQGQFNISGLQVERQYTLYFTAIGFVIKSLDVYVGGLNPHEIVYPCFDEDDIIKCKNTEKTERLGSISGCAEPQPDSYRSIANFLSKNGKAVSHQTVALMVC